jgi:hypothetical protein
MNHKTQHPQPRLTIFSYTGPDLDSFISYCISSALLLTELEQSPDCPLTAQDRKQTTKLEEHLHLLDTDQKPDQWL